MQASTPSIVQQIRIRDIGQGTEPVRIMAMRWLNDTEIGDGDAWDGGTDLDSSDDEEGGGLHNLHMEDRDEQENIGEWACMEVTFAFRGLKHGSAPKGGSTAPKSKNPFLLVNMSVGLKGVLGAPEVRELPSRQHPYALQEFC